ncbi:MAG: winged helix-turn-helix domain-containing protein [Nanoarchaeota archaeon]
MSKNYLMIDLHDERSARIAEVLSNNTAKKVIGLLAERELGQSELIERLKIPASTMDYTIKKLVSAGLIEQTKSLWSSKGKKVPIYRVSDRKIIISPKSMTKGVIPAIVASILGAGILKFAFPSDQAVANYASGDSLGSSANVASDGALKTMQSASELDLTGYYGPLATASPIWAWFLLGSLTVLVVFLLWNWRSN